MNFQFISFNFLLNYYVKNKIFTARFPSFLPFSSPPLQAKAIDRGDIEFTVCELNCHNAHEDQTSPQHERKPRFSSFKKSGAISKAVRSKLNLSKSAERSSEKQSSCGENSNSFDGAEKSETLENNGKMSEHQENSASTPTSAKSVPGKVVKKKSKLCLLL
jgi:cGMP-specific 3',5'-cyclic phosphodiesterase, invertebrate